MKWIRVFFTGMGISFLGTLPLGTLNVAAMQIAISDGIRNGILFSLGALVVEMVYVRVSLVGMDWVRRQQRILHWLEWFTFFIIAALAISSIYAALHPSLKKNLILSNSVHPFLLGLGMSAVNPVQIPFWFGWSTLLFTRKVLEPKSSFYNLYIIGIGIGTFAGNAVFIFGGRLIADKLSRQQNIISWVIGGIFALTALIMLWRLLRKKSALDTIHN